MKTIALALAAVIIASLGPQPAHALSCIQDAFDVRATIERSEVIFAGKLVSLSPSSIPGGYQGALDTGVENKAVAVFDVSRYWKGEVSKKMTVDVQLYGWYVSEPAFKAGEEYLIYADMTNGKLQVQVDCHRVPLLSKASEDLAALGAGKIPGSATPVYTFARNLMVGSTGSDVVGLQTFLEAKGLLVIPAGVAKGYFGPLTRAALAKYQASVGISPAAGYFGPITRAYIANL